MPQTSISLPFADGNYSFRLGLAQINEIQNRTGDGIGAVFARLLKGRYFQRTPNGEVAVGDPSQGEYRIEDILAVIRQGLLGGGKGVVDGQEVRVDAQRAEELVKNYVLAEGCPLRDSWALAAAILSVTIEGYEPPEPVPASKKKEGAAG
jgi:hypothetical protein